jgi:hypothetical protein
VKAFLRIVASRQLTSVIIANRKTLPMLGEEPAGTRNHMRSPGVLAFDNVFAACGAISVENDVGDNSA